MPLGLMNSLAILEAMYLLYIFVYFFLGVQAAEQNCTKKLSTLLLTFIYMYKVISSRQSSCLAPSFREKESSWFSLFVAQQVSQKSLD